MFEGFTLDRIDVGDAVLRVRHIAEEAPAELAALLAGFFAVAV